MKKEIIFKLVIIIGIIAIGIMGVNSKVEAVMKNNDPLLREIIINQKAIEPEFDQFITDYVMAVDSRNRTNSN